MSSLRERRRHIFRDMRQGRAERKRFERRGKDHSQALRALVQISFLLLNCWIGAQFFLWVRYYESGAQGWKVARPPGVEGWLPIASLMNLKAWILTGELPSIHAAGIFLLVAFLLIAFLLRKAFCSWLCPIGTLSETLGRFGEKIFGFRGRLPRLIDIPLRSLKYALLGLFLYAIGSMSVASIRAFLAGPYGIVADVKMLNFFRDLSVTASAILAGLVLASVFVRDFWCRYLCPYGAMMGLAALLSPVRVVRRPESCIDCKKCTRACPASLRVHEAASVGSPECSACFECVASCPAKEALDVKAFGRLSLSPVQFVLIMAFLFFGLVAAAHVSGHWYSEIPEPLLRELVPRASEFNHP